MSHTFPRTHADSINTRSFQRGSFLFVSILMLMSSGFLLENDEMLRILVTPLNQAVVFRAQVKIKKTWLGLMVLFHESQC